MLKSTVEMSGIHKEFTGDILWSVWVLQEKYLGSHLISTDDFSRIKRIRRASYLANN